MASGVQPDVRSGNHGGLLLGHIECLEPLPPTHIEALADASPSRPSAVGNHYQTPRDCFVAFHLDGLLAMTAGLTALRDGSSRSQTESSR